MGQSCSGRDGSGIRTVNLHGFGPLKTYNGGGGKMFTFIIFIIIIFIITSSIFVMKGQKMDYH